VEGLFNPYICKSFKDPMERKKRRWKKSSVRDRKENHTRDAKKRSENLSKKDGIEREGVLSRCAVREENPSS